MNVADVKYRKCNDCNRPTAQAKWCGSEMMDIKPKQMKVCNPCLRLRVEERAKKSASN